MPDHTMIQAVLQKHSRRIGLGIMAVIIFLLGWQGGVLSQQNAATQIVFKDRQCSACSSSGGTPQALEELRQQGIAEREQGNSGQVAAAVDAPSGKVFVGSVNSDLYHHQSCSAAGRIKAENQVWFGSVEEARAAGYSASKCSQDLGY